MLLRTPSRLVAVNKMAKELQTMIMIQAGSARGKNMTSVMIFPLSTKRKIAAPKKIRPMNCRGSKSCR